MDVALHTRRPAAPSGSPLTAAACTSAEEVLAAVRSGPAGETAADAARRQATLMGTVVDGRTGRGVVVATGIASQLRWISAALADRPVETQFQLDLRVGGACSRSAGAERGIGSGSRSGVRRRAGVVSAGAADRPVGRAGGSAGASRRGGARRVVAGAGRAARAAG